MNDQRLAPMDALTIQRGLYLLLVWIVMMSWLPLLVGYAYLGWSGWAACYSWLRIWSLGLLTGMLLLSWCVSASHRSLVVGPQTADADHR